MTTRERTLAILLFGLILLGAGGAAGYFFVWEPVRQKTAAAAKLEAENEELRSKRNGIVKDAKRLAEARKRSLPADENLARREYTEMMSRLLRQANVPAGFSVVPKPAPDTRSIPQLPGKKPAYTRVVSEIEFRKADLWAVQDFLAGYYKLNLLHQITAFSIKKEEEATGASGAARTRTASPDRKDLTVKLTTEAIILDGAESRRTLLPVSGGFAAVGGWGGYNAVALSPEAGRGINPTQFTPVLAKNRDYSLLALKDVFHGPLPPPELRLDKIENVAAELGKPIPAVKIPVKADPAYHGDILYTVTTDSKLFPDGTVKVDPTAKTVSFTPPEGESGRATFTLVARAENGQEAKSSFRVEVTEPEQPKEVEVVKERIDGAVILIAVSTRNDGTAFATIRDNANKYKYELEATTRRVKTTKFFYTAAGAKKKDPDYETPDELLVSDDWSATNRRFKVVAVDDEGLILLDLKAAEAKVDKAPAPRPMPGGGKGGPVPKGVPPRAAEGPADPAAAVAGAALVAGQPPTPTLYRWASGKSLTGLTEVPKDEAKRILQRAAQSGPVGATAVAAAAGN